MKHRSRREFLKSSVAAACATGVLPSLLSQSAAAADTSGYKALVCIFAFGGTDNNDVIIPRDNAAYQRFATTRADLLSTYAQDPMAASRARADLLPLLPENDGVFGGLEFGLAAEYAPLVDLFNDGEAAVVGSVGPLIEPTTRASFNNGSVALPKQLFSHNDQQSTWMALGAEGARTGWGGRFIEQIRAADPSFDATFAGVSTSGNSVLLGGGPTAAFSLPASGPVGISVSNNRNILGNNNVFNTTRTLLEDYYTTARLQSQNIFASDFESLQATGVAATTELDGLFEMLTPLTTQFPAGRLGGQLRAVAEMISLRGEVGVPRQVFFVGIGGFDTHDTQAADLPGLQAEIANGISSFRDAMVELGAWQDVTVFTAADFGRTLNDNGDGTDHGWGGHHFVAGGSVRGRRVYGGFPDSDVASPNYTDSRGRLIPSVSVEQYASTLGAWFGLTQAERRAALPNLVNFSDEDLGFMQL
ncbi:MAG: DUF1501 domain-containing protein [Pseudomonadota bacterium]